MDFLTEVAIAELKMPKALDRLGMTDFYDGFGIQGSSASKLLEIRDRLTSVYQVLSDFLMMGIAISEEQAAEPLISSVVSLLDPTGLVVHKDGTFSLGGLALYRQRGVWFFADAPQYSPALYFGTDSVGLVSRLQPSFGKSALDLCSGPGIQALVLAQSGMRTTSVDINPLASDICRLNVALNGLHDRVRVVTGDLYDAAEEGPYDLITANPPLLPIPNGVPYPFIGDGGPDGCSVVYRILEGARDRLSSSGSLILIGMTSFSLADSTPFEKLSSAMSKSGLAGILSIFLSLSTQKSSKWVQGLAKSSMAHNPRKYPSLEAAAAHISNQYESSGVDSVCSFVLRAWNDSSSSELRLRVQDFSGDDDGLHAWWF